MVEKIIDSPLPTKYRNEARRLRGMLPDEPARVEKHLEALAVEFASAAAYEIPTTDLFRCSPASTVHRHMTSPEWREIDTRSFLREAEASGDAAAFIRARIDPGTIIFPPGRSWLIDAPSVWDMDSRELKIGLELLDTQNPPYVLFRLTPDRMKAAGVGVRLPTALDAAAGGQPQWNPAGLRIGAEYLDKAVPIEAVEELAWKP